MNKDIAKEEIKQKEPDFLKPARRKINGNISYICPRCGNGSGSSGTGIALDPHNARSRRYKCFVCGLNEDIIGLWKLYNGVTDNKDAFTSLYDYYGLQVDSDKYNNYKTKKEIKIDPYTHKHIHTSTYTISKDKKNNNIDYYEACLEKVNQTGYFKKRGLTQEIVSKYMLGYDINYRGNTNSKAWKAIIIPTGTTSFVARNTDPYADKKDRYRKHGESQLYLKKTLWEAKTPIFIVEGELDTLSIINSGGEAVGLGSTANYNKLLQAVQHEKPSQPLILALDNDDNGEKTSQLLANELEKLKIPFYKYNPYGDSKDANEALIFSKQELEREINFAIEEVRNTEKQKIELQKKEYLSISAKAHLQEFINNISDNVDTPYIPTGFFNLDNAIDGGLYEGLYILGAISSLGKTSLALQIADQIAKSNNDVLMFSLEMARSELMSKSISRTTLLDIIKNNGDIQDAKTSRDITTGSRYEYYSQYEKDLIQKAVASYGEYAENIYIHESIGNIGTDAIKEEIKKHIFLTGRKPVVIIDYIQILSPIDIRATDKQNTDRAVLELKRISREDKLTIIGISSFNRANYNIEVSMEAFKESGSLEYGSDVLMGLQLKGTGGRNFDVNEAKQRSPRNIELVILKNRNGAIGKKIEFEYYPRFNYFREV